MLLDIESTQIHGASPKLNWQRSNPAGAESSTGRRWPIISPDGTFRHFTEPLEPGPAHHRGDRVQPAAARTAAKQQVSIVVPKVNWGERRGALFACGSESGDNGRLSG